VRQRLTPSILPPSAALCISQVFFFSFLFIFFFFFSPEHPAAFGSSVHLPGFFFFALERPSVRRPDFAERTCATEKMRLL
jgi:hypothetical protein